MEFFSAQDGGRIRSIAAGRHHSLALADDGRLFAWGSETWSECPGEVKKCGAEEENGDAGQGANSAGASVVTTPRLVDTAKYRVSDPVFHLAIPLTRRAPRSSGK